MKRIFTFIITCIFFLSVDQAMGQGTLLEWNFNTPTASGGKEVTFNATTSNVNMNLSTLHRGTGAIPKGGCGSAFVGQFTYSESLEEAIANNAYYEVQMFQHDKTVIFLSSLEFSIRVQTYAPTNYQWAYTINGSEPVMIGTPVIFPESDINHKANSSVNNNGVAQPTVSLEGITELQYVTGEKHITLRLYAWGGIQPQDGATDNDYVNFGFGKSTSTKPSLVIKGKASNHQYPLAWNFYGNKGTEENCPASSIDSNMEFPILTRGAGAPAGGGNSNGFSGTWTLSNSLEEAQANEAYYEFVVKSRNNASLSFNTLDAIFRAQTYSPKIYQWMYKIDNKAWVAIGSPVTIPENEVHKADNSQANSGFSQPVISLSGIADLQNVPASSSVAFRLYAWGGTIVPEGATDPTYINFGFGKSSSPTAKPALVIDATVHGGETSNEYQLLSGWNFGELKGITTGNVVATSNDEALIPSYLLRGDGLAGGSLDRSFASRDTLLISDEAMAIEKNGYFELNIEPKAGQQISLSKLVYKFRRANSNGPSDYSWKYSFNGVDFHPIISGRITSDDGNGVIMSPVVLSDISELQSVSSKVTLRMYVWGAKAVNVFGFGRGVSGDTSNIVSLYGSVSSTTGTEKLSEGRNSVKVISGSPLTVYTQQNIARQAALRLTDMTGRTMYSEKLEMQSGENTIHIPVSLQKGIYVVSLYYADGTSDHVKFAQ